MHRIVYKIYLTVVGLLSLFSLVHASYALTKHPRHLLEDIACKHDVEKAIQLLSTMTIDDINHQDASGETILHFFMKFKCNTEILQAVLQAGANPNLIDRYGNTPLHTIVGYIGNRNFEYDVTATKMLLAAGVCYNMQNVNEYTSTEFTPAQLNQQEIEICDIIMPMHSENHEFYKICYNAKLKHTAWKNLLSSVESIEKHAKLRGIRPGDYYLHKVIV
jgi:ankyrin repeat protein